MSIYSAWRFHNKDLFSKCSYYSKNFEPMKAKRKLLSKNHTAAAGTRLRSSPKGPGTSQQQHRGTSPGCHLWELPRGHWTCASLDGHTLQPCTAASLSCLLKSIPGLHSNGGICILTVFCNSVHKYAHCMLIVAGLIRTGCSCPWRHLLSNGTCVCREVTTPKPAGATVPGNTCFNK